MASDTYFLDKWRLATSHFDLFANHLRLFPFPPVFVLMRIVRIKFLDVEVLNIGDGVGDTPGDILVVPYDHSWRTRKTCSNDINIPGYQVILKPDRRYSLAQMRIVAENR